MTTTPKVKLKRKREYSPHHMLIQAATRAGNAAAKKEPGWFFDNLAAMTFSALAIEALCNSIGTHLVQDWEDFESSSVKAKVRLVARELAIPFNKNAEPWITARWLVAFRNTIAHPKPERIVEEQILSQEELDEQLKVSPQAKLEKYVTEVNAKRAIEAAKRIEELFVGALPFELGLDIALDNWSGSSDLFVPPQVPPALAGAEKDHRLKRKTPRQ